MHGGIRHEDRRSLDSDVIRIFLLKNLEFVDRFSKNL
jgi:hypothetical protein